MALSVSTITYGGARLNYGDIVYSQDGAGNGPNNAIFVADPTTGNRTIISQPGVIGSGPDFSSLIFGIAIEPTGQILLGGQGFTLSPGPSIYFTSIFRIDPATGNRSIVSSRTVGTGPTINDVEDLIVAPNGDIYATTDMTILKIDPITGNRTLVSGPDKGTGPTLEDAGGITFAQDGGLYSYDTDTEVVLHIDLLTGNRTVVSGGGVGSGPPFIDSPQFPVGVGKDIVQLNDGYLVTHQARTIFRIDPVTGDRVIISGDGVGSGPIADHINFLTLAPDGTVIASADAGIFRIDPTTGDRVIITGDSVGSGPILSGVPYREAVVVTFAVPETSSLVLFGLLFTMGGLIHSWKKKV